MERIRLRKYLVRRSRFASRGQEAMVRVKEARERGDEFVFLDLPKKPGIYRVKGRGKIDLIRYMGHRSVKSPRRANRWLLPAVNIGRRLHPVFFKRQLKKQMRYHKLKIRVN